VARASGTEHQDIVLDAHALADLDVRAKMLRARDLPLGFGDMDSSLYLLFRAIRDQSTVALSGESADEVFGGYLQFFDEEARRADNFPWLVRFGRHFGDDADVLRPDLTKALDTESYLAEGYRTAVSGIQRLDGESDFEYRMRRICNLHLTRFVRVLLDRKDRASMAVGLEVRVPFCDHRLVEYVYNTPWALKSYDGREKTLLREATADVLPKSVYDRVKSPYPSTQDPGYERMLRDQLAKLLVAEDSPVLPLINRDAARALTEQEVGSRSLESARARIENVLQLDAWLRRYQPTLDIAA
jgi:asparagine synthase (glutamine-hydrolysing)